MKFLLALLVLANVGMWMWATWYKEPAPRAEIPARRADINADKMRLVSEPGTRLVVRTRSTAARTSADAGDARCYRLGPFPSPDKAQLANVVLERWGVTNERVTEFQMLGTAYRLYLPPFASKEAAERQRRELVRLGFTDHALIEHEPGMENALSLGIFAVEQNAVTRRQQLAARGVHVSIQTVPNVNAIYWLALAGPAAVGRVADVPLARFAEHDWGAPGVGLKAAACNAAPRVR